MRMCYTKEEGQNPDPNLNPTNIEILTL